MFKIVSQLKFYGDKVIDKDMLEKMYCTFHPSNTTLSQQYQVYSFKKYSELVIYLLVDEQHNELLMKNHQVRSTGVKAFPKVNTVTFNNSSWSCVVVAIVMVVETITVIMFIDFQISRKLYEALS